MGHAEARVSRRVRLSSPTRSATVEVDDLREVATPSALRSLRGGAGYVDEGTFDWLREELGRRFDVE